MELDYYKYTITLLYYYYMFTINFYLYWKDVLLDEEDAI